MHFDGRHTSHFFPQTCTCCSSIYWKIHPFLYWFEMPPFPFPGYLVHFVSLMGLSLCYYHTSYTFPSFSNAPSGRRSAPTLGFSFLFNTPDALWIILSSSKSPACILRAWDLYIDLWWPAGIESDFSIFRVCPPHLATPLFSDLFWEFTLIPCPLSFKSMGLFGLCIPGF